MSATENPASAFPWAKRGTMRGKSKEIALCMAFSPDGSSLAVGYFDGSLAVFDVHALAVRVETVVQHAPDKPHPISAVCFRPTGSPSLLVGCTDGTVDRVDPRTLDRVSSFQEPGNEVNAIDYSADGTTFATCGRDAVVRVYHDAGQLLREFHLAPEYPANAAALRLFSVRFDPDNAKVLYSAGWSNTIHAHRLDDPVSSDVDGDHRHEFFGAYVTGDAMDVARGVLVTASHRLDDVIQLWDLKARTPTTVRWPVKERFLPNCARLSADAKYLAVGGGGGQGLKEGGVVIDLATGRAVAEFHLERTVASCAFSKREALVVFGDGEGHMHLFENRFAQRSK